MARPLSKKKLDQLIKDAFSRHGNGVSFSMLDLPKLWHAGRMALATGESIDLAMAAAVERYRVRS